MIHTATNTWYRGKAVQVGDGERYKGAPLNMYLYINILILAGIFLTG
jgi:hypothetical protein